MNAIAYVRTASKVDAVQVKEGKDRQEKAIEGYCRQHGLNLIRTFSDVGASGSHFNRNGWKDMERYMSGQQDDVRLLVVESYDRISRNYHSLTATIGFIERNTE